MGGQHGNGEGGHLARRDYSGPTKRSADVNDYVSLEADLAREKDHVRRLSARLGHLDRLARALAAELRAARSVDQAEVAAYAEARERALRLRAEDAAACRNSGGPNGGYYRTPGAVIDAGLEWTRRAVLIADAVATAVSVRPDGTDGGAR